MTAPGPTGDDHGAGPDPSRPKSWRNDGTGVLHDAYAQFRTFERAREGRLVAGVCAGVGRRLGIDPVVIRIVIAVLALVSGAGLVLYGAGWLLLPEHGSDRSIVDRMLGRQSSEPNGAIVVGVGAIAALVAMSLIPWGEDWWGPVLVAGIIAGLVALARRRPDESSADPLSYLGGPGDVTAASAPTVQQGPSPEEPAPATRTDPMSSTVPVSPASPTGSAATHATGAVSATTDGPAVDGTEPTPTPPAHEADATRPIGGTPSAPPRTWTQHAATPPPPSFWDQPDPLGLENDPADAPTGHPPAIPAPAPAKAIERPRSALFPITIGVALLSLFVLAAASGAGERIPLVLWAAAPLGVIGLGLLVGTWYGRSGGLIALGIPLAIALVPLGVVDAVAQRGYWPEGDASVGDQRFEPATVAEIEPIYRHGAGDFTLDLTNVVFADRDTVDVSVESGFGEVSVIVPDNVDVSITGEVGLGDAALFGDPVSGSPTPRFEQVDEGTDGAGGGQLNLEVTHGMGDLDIERASAAADGPRPAPPERPHAPNVEDLEEREASR